MVAVDHHAPVPSTMRPQLRFTASAPRPSWSNRRQRKAHGCRQSWPCTSMRDSENRIGITPLPSTEQTLVYRAGLSSSQSSPDVEPEKTTGMSETGFDSAESCLAIAADGTIFFAPAFTDRGAAVLRSLDEGKSWQPCIIEGPEGKHHGRPQPYLHLDYPKRGLSPQSDSRRWGRLVGDCLVAAGAYSVNGRLDHTEHKPL
jgi:hypothetical protein